LRSVADASRPLPQRAGFSQRAVRILPTEESQPMLTSEGRPSGKIPEAR